MHGPWRANLERSNQSAHKQSAQPEETPPQRAGKRAKACQRAISVAAYRSEWTSRPASFFQKLDDRGKQTRAWLPGTRAQYSRVSFYCKPETDRRKRRRQPEAVSRCEAGGHRQAWSFLEFRSLLNRSGAGSFKPVSSRSSPSSEDFQAGRYLLHRNHKDTASLRTKFVSRRGFDFVLRSLPSPTAELQGK